MGRIMRAVVLMCWLGSGVIADVQAQEASATSIRSTTPPAKYWLRMYPLRDYGLLWHIELEVQNLTKARDKVLRLMKKYGGTLSQPVENFPSSQEYGYQQLSYRIGRKAGGKALEKLKSLGRVRRLLQKPNEIVGVLEESRDKLAKLQADRESLGMALEKAPSLAAATGEIIEHLENVYKSYKDSEELILFNIVLETPKK